MVRPLALRLTRLDAGIVFYAVMVSVLAQDPWRTGNAWGAFALVTIPVAVLLRNRPHLAAATIIAGSTILRVAYYGVGIADQLDISHAAAERLFAGSNPYGVGYAVSIPPGTPYSYGPLGLVWWLPGRPLELVGAVGVMAVLAHQRAWLTLAFVASWPFMVYMTTSGINDYSVGFVLIGSLVLMKSHARLAMAGLAIASAIKPYAAAWAVAGIGFAGFGPFALFAALSLVLWTPILWWGPASYLASMRGVEILRESFAAAGGPAGDGGSLNIPAMRWLSVPAMLAGIWLRSWRVTLLLGAAAFSAVLFFSPWASGGYWVILLPIIGLAIEAPVAAVSFRPSDTSSLLGRRQQSASSTT